MLPISLNIQYCYLMKNIILLITLAIFLVSCGGGSDSDGGSDGPQSNACSVLGLGTRIINGTACDSTPSPVVKIRLDGKDGTSICTGSMITSRKVLTASHCVTLGTFTSVISPSDVSISTGNISTPIANARRIYNATAAIADLQRIDNEAAARGDSERIDNDINAFFDYVLEFGLSDIAVIELDRSVNLPTIPIKVSSFPSTGTVLSIFGYGVNDGNTSVTPTALFSGQMLSDANGPKNIFARFDGNGSNTCGGDSGGPLVEQLSDGTAVVVGTTLGGTNSNCSAGDRSSFTATAGAGIVSFLRTVAPEANYR